MLKLLESFDQFGAAFQPRIQYSKSQHKTILGGIMSILIYGMSLIYLIYVFYQWQSGITLPKLTITQKILQNQQFILNETYIQFETKRFSYTLIDPFNPEALILQPKIFYFRNGKLKKEKSNNSLGFEYKEKDGFYQLQISTLKMSLSSEKTEDHPQDEFMITLGRCTKKALIENQKCANESQIEAYFKQFTNVLVIKQYLKEFNPQTKNIEIIGRESLMPIQQQSTSLIQNHLRILNSFIDTGTLFESIQQQSTNLNLEYFSQITGNDIYLALYYQLDNIQQEQTITYPKLSEVLAEANSIASTLLLLSYFVIMINQNQLHTEAINSVIGMYFPDFKKIKIKKDFLGRIKIVEKEGRQLDLRSFQQQLSRLTKIGQTKLSISNQIYELSRIQFMLQSLFTSQQMKEYHQIGIPFHSIFIEPSSRDDSNTFKLEVISLNSMFKSPQVHPALTQVHESDSQSKQFLQESDFELLII